MRTNEININRLVKTFGVFERFRTDMVTDRDQAGAVQAFEFCKVNFCKVDKALPNII